MVTIVGVRFKKAGKIYYFAPGELKLEKGDHVIVETARGIEYGQVVIPQQEVPEDKRNQFKFARFHFYIFCGPKVNPVRLAVNVS